jgi:Zn-dependent metalloprotease
MRKSILSSGSLPAALALALLATTAGAYEGLPSWIDPSRRDEARRKAASNPLGLPLLEHAERDAKSLGFSADDGFVLIRASEDDLGWTHAHLQQTFRGIPVRGGRLIVHRRPDGTYAPYSDAGIRGIKTPEVPRLTAEEAIKVAEADDRHRFPFAVVPRTELAYLPVYRYVLARSGAPVPPTRYDPSAELAMHEPVDADDVVKQVDDVLLAWKVTGIERDAERGDYPARQWWVDAQTGRVARAGDLDESATATGHSYWYGVVDLQTQNGSCFHMTDTDRQFTTETEDFGSDHVVNCDANNIWGNGLAFAGNASASNSNWQTAMVDGHFGATVYWDLMDHVFNLQGPDDDFYSVNVFMHHLTNHDDAHYHSTSGNVSFGDSTDGVHRTRLDCLGHELGHAWNDHNSGYGGGTALNESLGDVFGEWTDAYRHSGGFASGSSTIGTNADTAFVNRCSGRDLIAPGSNGHPTYWYADILDAEEHFGSAPASRAFTFLARGSGSWHRNRDYSRKLPWGMAGSGLQTAARIFYRAHRDWLADEDYQGLRVAMRQAANQLFGSDVTVRNAYAGINVGAAAPGMPAAPPVTAEVEPNNTLATAQSLGWGMSPPAGAVLPAPRKIKVRGSGHGDDWYRVTLTGSLASVMLTPTVNSVGILGSYGIEIVWSDGYVLDEKSPRIVPQRVENEFFVDGTPYTLWIHVVPGPGTNTATTYELDIDLMIN